MTHASEAREIVSTFWMINRIDRSSRQNKEKLYAMYCGEAPMKLGSIAVDHEWIVDWLIGNEPSWSHWMMLGGVE